MHTFGAVILAVVGVVLVQFVLGFVSAFLFEAIVTSTGAIWLPILIMIGLTACGYYGGLYFALKLVPRADSRIAFFIVVAVIVLGSAAGIIGSLTEYDSVVLIVIQVVNGIAAMVGVLIARSHIDQERKVTASATP
jgi:hypothetical protein